MNSSTAVGAQSVATGNFSTAYGAFAVATGDEALALGVGTKVEGKGAIAIGNDAEAKSSGSVALGSGSNDGGRSNVVSVGTNLATRAIINVSAGTEATDAANVGQVMMAQSYATGYTDQQIGGGKAIARFAGIDAGRGRITSVANGVLDSDAANFGQVNAVETRVKGFATQAADTAKAEANKYTDQQLSSGTVAARFAGMDAGNNKITGVADGMAATDAANVGQVNSAETRAKDFATQAANAAERSANSYTVSHTSQQLTGGTVAARFAGMDAGNSKITGVADGTAATDAANLGQVLAAQAAAIAQTMNMLIKNGTCTISGNAFVCGPSAQATGNNAMASGINAVAEGDDTTAVGSGAVARFAGSVAIGSGAKALADPTTAVGNNAVAMGNNSVALGANTTALGDNSVALGQGSLADRDNSVSVGNAATGLTRAVTNVAPGMAGTDAVNVNQLNQATGHALAQANTYAARGVAAAMAVPPIPALAPGRKWLGAGVGSYGGQAALGVAFGYQTKNGYSIGGGISAAHGSSQVAARVHAGFDW